MTYIDFIFAIMSQLVKYIDGKNELSCIEDDIDELYKYWKDEQIIEKVYHLSGEAGGGFKSKLTFLKNYLLKAVVFLKPELRLKKRSEPKLNLRLDISYS